jgi:methyl-accepting chemotaxis protein
MKVSMKLIVSFVIVVVLAAIVGGVGIVGMLQLDKGSLSMYENQTVPLPYLSKVIESLQRLRVNNREYAIGAATGNMEQIEKAYTQIQTHMATMTENLDLFEITITNPDGRRLFDEARAFYDTEYKASLQECYDLAKAGDTAGIVTEMATVIDGTDMMVDNYDQLFQIRLAAAKTAADTNSSLAQTMLIVIVAVLVAAVVIAMLLAFYISGLISKPLRDMMGYIKQAGETGNLHFRDDEWANCDKLSQIKDEIGQCMNAFTKMMRKFVYYGEIVGIVAEKDLTVQVQKLGEQDTFGNSLELMVDNLNKMFSEINTSSNQVSTGAVQIADGAQLLAQGATEQSATVEELSASITEVNGQTKANAGLANDAKKLGEDIKVNAERGNTQMEQMIKAVGEISDASTAIGKVIKIIDDIAFQTNILALNAAVEAARAGQHGKGFAVVADEVRSLAAKSAEAAKNTRELIATSIEKSEQGAAISQETAESLSHIVSGIIQSSELVAKIAESSNQQSISIGQIGEAIDQVSQVIQQNSATAEESAAASEEMSGQATMLQQLIAQFKLKNQAYSGINHAQPRQAATPAPVSSPSSGFAIGDGGKY